jgi:putative membrane protein
MRATQARLGRMIRSTGRAPQWDLGCTGASATGVAYGTFALLAARAGRGRLSASPDKQASCAQRMPTNEGRAMTTTQAAEKVPLTSNQLAEERTDLAANRTRMAADRSLMAWVRTGLSMISFGFTLYKLLEGFQEKGAAVVDTHSPRTVGMFLTGLGTVAIVMGTVEYWHRRKELLVYGPVSFLRPAFVMAMIMSLTGLFLFFGIISRLL